MRLKKISNKAIAYACVGTLAGKQLGRGELCISKSG